MRSFKIELKQVRQHCDKFLELLSVPGIMGVTGLSYALNLKKDISSSICKYFNVIKAF